ncbi:MAG: hypothetical protein LC117_04275 [Bacteroidia bacterium]|nr:VWA domain-containing protein [Bacteroidia bacterium]MCZ2277125.1 hypothetical protein [Bacteroidia bacterium]
MFKKLILTIAIFGCFAFRSNENNKSSAEVAIVADLSGSTNGLLDDLRDNLWNFIYYFNRSNPEVEMRLAFVGFSRKSFGIENGYVRVLTDLTTHYDLVSSKMFNLVSNVEKGDQYVGAALRASVKNLSWSNDKATRRMILLFGNSRADLGNVDYHNAMEGAISKGIVINSVYCIHSEPDEKILAKWYTIADGTGGELYTYRVTKRLPNKNYSLATERLIDLNNSFNETFIPFNKKSSEIFGLMLTTDVNALQMSEHFFVSRCCYKLTPSYQNLLAANDLVSYYEANQSLPDYNRNFLPKDLCTVTEKELKDIAKIRYDRRKRLIEKLNQIITQVDFDKINSNPIDSIFAHSVSKHF